MCKYLGEELTKFEFIDVDLNNIETNMCYLKFNDKCKFDMLKLQEFLAAKKIRAPLPTSLNSRARLMTHFYIREKEIKTFIDAIKEFLSL